MEKELVNRFNIISQGFIHVDVAIDNVYHSRYWICSTGTDSSQVASASKYHAADKYKKTWDPTQSLYTNIMSSVNQSCSSSYMVKDIIREVHVTGSTGHFKFSGMETKPSAIWANALNTRPIETRPKT